VGKREGRREGRTGQDLRMRSKCDDTRQEKSF